MQGGQLDRMSFTRETLAVGSLEWADDAHEWATWRPRHSDRCADPRPTRTQVHAGGRRMVLLDGAVDDAPHLLLDQS